MSVADLRQEPLTRSIFCNGQADHEVARRSATHPFEASARDFQILLDPCHVVSRRKPAGKSRENTGWSDHSVLFSSGEPKTPGYINLDAPDSTLLVAA